MNIRYKFVIALGAIMFLAAACNQPAATDRQTPDPTPPPAGGPIPNPTPLPKPPSTQY